MLAISPAVAGPVGVEGITTHVVIVKASAPVQDTGEAKATCPAGQLRVGGGYVIDGGSTLWRVYVDAPLHQRAWLVEVVNFNSDVALNFSAYAICAMSVSGGKGISGYTTDVVHTAVSAPANDTAEADATCPAGQLRTGGGYDVFNVSANWSIYLNGPDHARTWIAEIDNEVPVATTFDSYAVCLANKNSKPVKTLKTTAVHTHATAPANGSKTAGVSCGTKELMTGGGWQVYSVGQDWIVPISAPVSKNDWQVRLTDLDGFSRQFDSKAVCLAKA